MTSDMYEFQRKLRSLEKLKGDGTQLISLYIQPETNVNEISARLRDEYSQSSNIKSKTTRKNVQSALEKLIQKLKGVSKPPENGVVLFCGNIDGKIELYEVIPPEPVPISIYRCDSRFYLDPLKDMTKIKNIIGLFTVDRKEACVALLKGRKVEILDYLTSGIPGKHRQGGQSAQRFERLHELAIHEFFKRVADRINQYFSTSDVTGVIVGGPGPTKNYFINEDYLQNRVKNKIIAVVDTGYTDEQGIQEIVNKIPEILKEHELTQEKKIVSDFIYKVMKGDRVIFGKNQTLQALLEGRLDTLLVSEEYDKEFYVDENNFIISEEKIPNGVKVNLIDYLTEKCHEFGTEMKHISPDSAEGKQFLMAFDGIGGYLRW
jgi:peptide chain release factor subunit 1